jgi:DNA polymerase III subunit alpha
VNKIRFANHHHHTAFSFADGFGMPAEHVARAVALGYGSITVTEHGNVSSHFQLEKAALAAGIKPLFGLEAYCGAVDEERRGQFKNHLTILAENSEGYRNLNKIVTQSYLDYYYHPTVSGASLAAHREGLVILSGCSGSQLACALLGGKGIPEPESRDGYAWDDARLVIERFLNWFKGSYYLEVQPFYELERSCKMNSAYERLSREFGIQLVVTHDAHYPTMGDAEMQAVLHAVHRGKASVDDAMREWNYDVPLTLPESDRELVDRLIKTGLSKQSANSAIDASAEIAERCNVTLPKAARLRYPVGKADLEPWS